jgi:hypothetical protein
MNGTFYIHNNFDRPYKVRVVDETKKWAFVFAEKRSLGQKIATPERYKVQVQKWVNLDDTADDDDNYSNDYCLDIPAAKKVFIGESPLNAMTRWASPARPPATISSIYVSSFSGGHGSSFYGNTILLERAKNSYIWIGDCIKEFQVIDYPIVEFVSPVGNNDVPYPWARDAKGNTYLMIEDVIMDKSCVWKNDEDACPYDYYYTHGTMTKDLGRPHSRAPPHPYFRDLSGFRVGVESYTLRYNPTPAKNYDWLKFWDEGDIIFEFRNGLEKLISKEEYVSIMEAYGEERGFRPLHTKIIK